MTCPASPRPASPHPVLPVLAALAFTALLVAACTPASDAEPDRSSPAPPSPTAEADTSDARPVLPDSLRSPPDAATRARFDSIMHRARIDRLRNEPLGDVIAAVGRQFSSAPYRAGTLDEPPEETLVVHLDGFDCVTFVETALALGRGIAQGDTSYTGFAQRLAGLRYRGGTIGYCQRLHYFSDWIDTNRRRGRLRTDLNLPGRRVLQESVDFMSTHRSSYSRLAASDSLYRCIRNRERTLQAGPGASRPYVPQDSIRAAYPSLQSGDVIALITSVDGLFVTHTGLAVEQPDGSFGLLHASTTEGVMVSPDIQRYVQQIDHQIGIVVARPVAGRHPKG